MTEIFEILQITYRNIFTEMKSTTQLIMARMLSRDLSSVPCMLSSQSSQGNRSKTMRKYSKRKLSEHYHHDQDHNHYLTQLLCYNFALLCHSSCPPYTLLRRYNESGNGKINIQELKTMMEKLKAPQTHLGLLVSLVETKSKCKISQV